MSNVELHPEELACRGQPVAAGHDPVTILTAREVPLGGPRAIKVRRTLPQRARSLIGAWCFIDHYGPHDVTVTGGMDVPPHPHTGLQTVSWLFDGEVEHRDSSGVHALVHPSELNLMTSGYGICHSEVSTAQTTTLRGVQLWIALPDDHRNTSRAFQHYVPTAVNFGDATVRVFLGSLAGDTSTVETYTPLLGAEISLAPHAEVELDVDPLFEHGILVDAGTISVAETVIKPADLGYIAPGPKHITLANHGAKTGRVLLLGGTPFTEEILMWWNFVARSHEEIVSFRNAWQDHSDQFGDVTGYQGALQRLPAPEIPNVKIKPRRQS